VAHAADDPRAGASSRRPSDRVGTPAASVARGPHSRPTQRLGAPARSLNDDHDIAGSFSAGPGETSGSTLDVWNNLTAFDATLWTSWTAAVGINNYGTVVGQYVASFSPGMVIAGFLRDASARITLLPARGGSAASPSDPAGSTTTASTTKA
jgi:hypothetical protein